MGAQFILTDYVKHALAGARCDKLEDGTSAARIPACEGVVAFGATLHERHDELRFKLEDWVLVALKLGQPV